MSLVIAENIYKTYLMDKIQVNSLKNINLNIEQGSFVCVVGPSGSGKSTLLNLIGCLDKPSRGKSLKLCPSLPQE